MAAINMNQNQFQEMLQEGKTVLADFWAPWCSYCRRIGPAFDKISEQYHDQLIAAKINIDEEAALAEAMQIELIPTLILYRDGKAIGSITAPESKAAIDAFIQKTLAE